MILKKLTVQGYGPFYQSATLELDPQVTILTGKNDVGKSALLRLIHMICNGTKAGEDDVNNDRILDADVPLEADREVLCTAVFEVGSDYEKYLTGQAMSIGAHVEINFELTRGKSKGISVVQNTGSHNATFAIQKMPQTITFSTEEKIGSTIRSDTDNPLERKLLLLAFGEGYHRKLHLNSAGLSRIKRAANKQLNEHLSRILPQRMGNLIIDIEKSNQEQETATLFTIAFQDDHDGDTPLTLRGAGIRKIISLLVTLLSLNLDEQIYILLDEPENSLHADAQHTLRKLLEELGRNENVQVIYATHSPSMINSVDPAGLRLIERTSKDNKATSIIKNKPIDDNFHPVRSSLGITPSDSLLYSPITILVEGLTEIQCIPYVLLKFCKGGIEGFEQVSSLLSLCHFIGAQGVGNLDYLCKLVRSQGCDPIIFVDGDMKHRVEQLQRKGKLLDVPIVSIADSQEFENVISQDIYFEALQEENDGYDISLEKFSTWEQSANLPEKLAFSKRVATWLGENHPEVVYRKPSVMKHALEKVEDCSLINSEPFKRLIDEISIIANQL